MLDRFGSASIADMVDVVGDGMRIGGSILASALACAAAGAAAQTPPALGPSSGDELLKRGLSGRLTPLDDGVTIKRTDDGRVDAGYFLIRIIDNNLPDAQICPKVAFGTTTQGKRWRALNDQIYDTVFERKGLWGINARVIVANPLNKESGQEIRLVSVKRPESSNCEANLLGTSSAITTPPRYVFPTPINYRENIYGQVIDVHLRSVHQLEPNQQRINELWAGLGLFAKVAYAPLAPLVESLSGVGKAKVSEALTIPGGEAASAPLRFDARSTEAKTRSVFFYLGFSDFGQTAQSVLKGGVTIRGDYLASVFRPQQFYSETTAPSADDIKRTSVFIDANGVGQTIGEKLGQDATVLIEASTTDGFSGSCKTTRANLLKLGLSEVDADAWLWAMAADSSHPDVSGKLVDIGCLKDGARANLARLHITIEPKIVPPPPGVKVTLPVMHDAMLSLATLMGQEGVTAAAAAGFSDQINLILGDDAAVQLIGGEASGPRPKAEVLELMRAKFARGGCWAPRVGRETLDLPLRPSYGPLPAGGRAGAMLALSAGPQGVPYILSLGFDPVVPGATARISTIAIKQRGADTGKVVEELTVGRRPGNCAQDWMDPVFATQP